MVVATYSSRVAAEISLVVAETCSNRLVEAMKAKVVVETYNSKVLDVRE